MEQQEFDFMSELTSLQEAPLAKTSVSQACGRGGRWIAVPEAPCAGNSADSFQSCTLGVCFGKMFRGAFPATAEQTSVNSWPRLCGSGIAYRGEYLTHNTPEWTAGPWPFHKDADVCGLWDFLESPPNVPAKYYLSPKACVGVMRRAVNRGKIMPVEMLYPLLAQANMLSVRGGYAEFLSSETAATIRAAGGSLGGGSETLISTAQFAWDSFTSCKTGDVVPTITTRGESSSNGARIVQILEPDHCTLHDTARTITGDHCDRVSDTSNLVAGGQYVRRLMPVECERLMGYPEGYTKVSYGGRDVDKCPDSPRYQACGNGWAINCARWVLLGIHRYLEERDDTETTN